MTSNILEQIREVLQELDPGIQEAYAMAESFLSTPLTVDQKTLVAWGYAKGMGDKSSMRSAPSDNVPGAVDNAG